LRSNPYQSVVICGESGAGKTVTSTKMLEYLLDAEQFSSSGKLAGGFDKKKIAQCNVLLEYFGNAKTLRNDNSSRFGKYSQLHFDQSYGTQSFEIEHYVLERSRIVSVPAGERNYHIFHELTVSSMAADLGLGGGPTAFQLTSSGAVVKQAGGKAFNDVEDFEELCRVMDESGFDEKQRMDIFETVAAVLHLGEVQFEGDRDSCQVQEASKDKLTKACELLGVDSVDLAKALTVKKTDFGHFNLSDKEALGQRSALAKVIYARVFDGIVQRINEALQAGGAASAGTVGLLDIFGFEDMPINGLEQIYINLTNERIQNLFTNLMFQRELQIYKEEGIESAFDPGPSNWPCIELFTSHHPPGIVSLIADEVNNKAGGKDGAALVRAFNTKFKTHAHYTEVSNPGSIKSILDSKKQKWKMTKIDVKWDECFRVRHYAGDVVYTVSDFVGRSRDALQQNISSVMRASSKDHVSALFSDSGSTKLTVGEVFCKQLERLAGKLQQGSTLFVRCIKPNPRMLPGQVDRQLTLEQLVYGGVISVLEIRKHGFADRVDYQQFYHEFKLLALGQRKDHGGEIQDACVAILNDFVAGDSNAIKFALGLKRVFMKSGVLSDLRKTVNFRICCYTRRFQRKWRSKKGLELFHKLDKLKDRIEEVRSMGVTAQQAVEARARAEGLLEILSAAASEARRQHADVLEAQAAMDRHVSQVPDLQNRRCNSFKLALGELWRRMDEAAEQAKKASEQAQQAEKRFASRLTEVRTELSAMQVQVDQLQALCATPDAEGKRSAEDARLSEVCQQAAQKILCILEHDLRKFQEDGLSFVGSQQDADPCPQASRLLEEVAELVRQAELQADALKRARFAFAQQSSGAHAKFVNARSSLEAMQQDAQVVIDEGLNAAGEAMDAAWRKEAFVVETQRAATDAEAYEAAVADFVNGVEEAERQLRLAEEFLARKKQEEEEARLNAEREEAERLRTALKGLDQHAELEKHGAALLRALVAAGRQLEAASEEGQQQDASTNLKLRAKLHALEEGLRFLGATEADPEAEVTRRLQEAAAAKWQKRSVEGKIRSLKAEAAEAKEKFLLEMRGKERGYEDQIASLRAESEQAVEAQRHALEEKIGAAEAQLTAERRAAEAKLQEQRQQLEGRIEGERLAAAQELSRADVQVQACAAQLKELGAWSASRSRELGGTASELAHGRATLLDQSVCASVSGAIEALNSGVIVCPEGFCIVYSRSMGTFYLLWRQDKFEAAAEALGVDLDVARSRGGAVETHRAGQQEECVVS